MVVVSDVVVEPAAVVPAVLAAASDVSEVAATKSLAAVFDDEVESRTMEEPSTPEEESAMSSVLSFSCSWVTASLRCCKFKLFIIVVFS